MIYLVGSILEDHQMQIILSLCGITVVGGIFYLMCFGTNGADKDVSLLGKKLQMVDTEHPSPLMRSKRDSHIDREGMYLYLNIIIIWSYQLTQNTIIGQIGSFLHFVQSYENYTFQMGC